MRLAGVLVITLSLQKLSGKRDELDKSSPSLAKKDTGNFFRIIYASEITETTSLEWDTCISLVGKLTAPSKEPQQRTSVDDAQQYRSIHETSKNAYQNCNIFFQLFKHLDLIGQLHTIESHQTMLH